MNWSQLPMSWPGIGSVVIATLVYLVARTTDSPGTERGASHYFVGALVVSLVVLTSVGWVHATVVQRDYYRCVVAIRGDSEEEPDPCLRAEYRHLSLSRLYLSPGNAAGADRRLAEIREQRR